VHAAGRCRLHEAVELFEEHGDHRVTSALGPQVDVDRTVLGQGPHVLGVVRDIGRGLAEETLEPGDGSVEVAHGDACKQVNFHAGHTSMCADCACRESHRSGSEV
jgi:hypothetical protein